jgi:hypothetical protein
VTVPEEPASLFPRAQMPLPSYPVPPERDDPRLRAIWDYWCSRHRGGRLPGRRDIDPLHIPRLLGHIGIIEVLRQADGGRRFRFRLWGTRLTELYGRDYTGSYLEDVILPTRVEAIRAVFEMVVLTHLPHFWQVPVPAENRDFISNRRLLMPLASDGETVDALLGFAIGDPPPRRR